MQAVSDFPTFADFYSAVNGGQEPFPWQGRLAAAVAAGSWPDTIGVPTGMGKTACLDIAVWALAHDASLHGSGRFAATRTYMWSTAVCWLMPRTTGVYVCLACSSILSGWPSSIPPHLRAKSLRCAAWLRLSQLPPH